MPIAPAASLPWAGNPLNAFTMFSGSAVTCPLANRKMSKMIRMTTSLISPIASTMLETRTSKKVRI